MGKILLFLVLGVFLLGIMTAVSLSNKDFTEKVLTISTEKICEVELLSNVLSKRCNKNTPKEISVDEDIISITKNLKTGVIRIKHP